MATSRQAVRRLSISLRLSIAAVAALASFGAAAADLPFGPGFDHNIEFDALLMLDVANANGVYADQSGEERFGSAGVRRARIGAGAALAPQWQADIALDLPADGRELELHELSIGWQPTDRSELVAGLVKQPFGMENSSSSSRLRTMERSMATNAFVPDRGAGLVVFHERSRRYSGAGVFVDPEVDEVRTVSARSTWAPIDQKRRVLHVGVSGAWRDNAGVEYRIRDEGGIAIGRNVFKSGKYTPSAVTTLGIEAAWARDGVSLQSELFGQRLSGADEAGAGDPTFTGSYVQVGWVLGGGRRKYADGRFGKVVGGKGDRSIELVAGAGRIDTVFDGKGDSAQEFVVGANLQLTDHLRLNGQVQHLAVADADGSRDSGNGVLMRLQLDL